ncbi:MAG: hypothetical protein QG567_1269 [Campylobacterota bacterium]|nr:hypothetical protein [Campylobacterota bacterium]
MLILGRKYKFTQLELDRLNKKFKNISHIRYRDRPQEEVLKEIDECVHNNNFDILVLNTRAKVSDDIIKYLTKLQFEKRKKRVQIITIEHFMEAYLQKCYIPDDLIELNFLEDIKPFNPLEYSIKRTIDYIGVFILLLITWPAMVYAKYKINSESPGPIMFKQLRVGQNNEEFICVKFRSMYLDAEANGAQFASKNDPRVFQWGEFMRKTRID